MNNPEINKMKQYKWVFWFLWVTAGAFAQHQCRIYDVEWKNRAKCDHGWAFTAVGCASHDPFGGCTKWLVGHYNFYLAPNQTPFVSHWDSASSLLTIYGLIEQGGVRKILRLVMDSSFQIVSLNTLNLNSPPQDLYGISGYWKSPDGKEFLVTYGDINSFYSPGIRVNVILLNSQKNTLWGKTLVEIFLPSIAPTYFDREKGVYANPCDLTVALLPEDNGNYIIAISTKSDFLVDMETDPHCWSNVLFIRVDTLGNDSLMKMYTSYPGLSPCPNPTTYFGDGIFALERYQDSSFIGVFTGLRGLGYALFDDSFQLQKWWYLATYDSIPPFCNGGCYCESGHFMRLLRTQDQGYLGIGFTTLYGAGREDILLIKWDSTLNMEWTRTIGTSAREIPFVGIEKQNGGYFIGGITFEDERPNPYETGFIVSLDSLGEIVWAKRIAGSQVISKIHERNDGSLILVGASVGDSLIVVEMGNDGSLCSWCDGGIWNVVTTRPVLRFIEANEMWEEFMGYAIDYSPKDISITLSPYPYLSGLQYICPSNRESQSQPMVKKVRYEVRK